MRIYLTEVCNLNLDSVLKIRMHICILASSNSQVMNHRIRKGGRKGNLELGMMWKKETVDYLQRNITTIFRETQKSYEP